MIFFTSVVLFNSEELLSALGVDGNKLPPLIYRMRQLGYPPGWLKEAEVENSGLKLYDGKSMFLNKTKNSQTKLFFNAHKLDQVCFFSLCRIK